jgi:hypothetical protein
MQTDRLHKPLGTPPRNPKQARVKLARVQSSRRRLSAIDKKVEKFLLQISQCSPGAVEDGIGRVHSATKPARSKQADDPVLLAARVVVFWLGWDDQRCTEGQVEDRLSPVGNREGVDDLNGFL